MSSKTEETPTTFGHGNDDAAVLFLRANRDVDATLHLDQKYISRLRRRVDVLVMPFLFLCYALNYLDKAAINYANVMGLTQDLNLQGNDFSNAGSAFWIAAVIAALPNIYLLQRVPTAKWLALNIIGWGICTACHAALHNFAEFVTLRVLCGMFESAVPSSLMLLSAQYYTREEQPIRFAYWFCGQGLGQIVGGLLSWASQHGATSGPNAGWRMLFLAIGLLSILLGICIVFIVPDTPWQAWFLTTEQKVNLLEHVRVNQSGIQSHWETKQVLEALGDMQVWLGLVIVIIQGAAGATIAIYSSTLLHSFGYSAQESALLNMPPGAINIIAVLGTGLLARRFGLRWIWCSAIFVISAAGAAMMGFSNNNQAASLAGLYLLNFAPGGGPVSWQWILTNTAGNTKRAFVADLINAAFGLGSIIGPQTFQARDAPQYQPAKITLVCFYAFGISVVTMLASYYWSCNRRRVHSQEVSEDFAYAGLTDKQNHQFTYVY